jgi:tripartite-type tricarboxylate transporter receptor subunit TctC
MLVPAGTPQPIVDFLYRELMKVMQTEDVKQKLGNAGLEVSPTRQPSSPRHQGGRREVGKVVKDAGIKLE